MLTVDANVFISASTPTEVFHADSDNFLLRAGRGGVLFFCPTLVLPEIASGIIRPTGDVVATQEAVRRVQTLPGLTLVDLTDQRALRAARAVSDYRLRGADAVYIAVAQEHGTTLITWDKEVLTRGAQAVPTMTPTDWLAANPI